MSPPGKAFAAFYSYVRQNDTHDHGKLSQIRKQLAMEVWAQTGNDFEIFQDRENVEWGEAWKDRIEKAIDDSTFLIVVVTPSFLKSSACRSEVERFLRRENELKRNDLIFPLLYIDTPDLNDKSDPIAVAISNHQWADWRDIRSETLSSAKAKKRLEKLAKQIRNAIERTESSNKLLKSLSNIPNSTISQSSQDSPDWDNYIVPQIVFTAPVTPLDDVLPMSQLESISNSLNEEHVTTGSDVRTPSSFLPIAPPPQVKPVVDEGLPPQLLTVLLRPSGDPDRDRRRIKNVYGILISHPGKDRFQFQIFENNQGHLIDFPNDTTRICAEMLERLKKLMGEESWRIEEITYQ